MVGYQPSAHAFRSVEAAAKLKQLRQDLLIQLKILFPSQMRIIKRNDQTQRRTVELDNDVQIAVHICRPLTPTVGGKPRWMLTGPRKEGGLPALICLCDKGMSELTSFHVVPEFGDLIRRNKVKVLREGHPWLAAGKRLESLSQFYEVAKEVAGGWQPQHDITAAGDVVLTGRTSTITISGKAITLPRIETAIFKLLVHNAGRVVAPENLCRCFDEPSEWFLRAHISGLRRKLGRRFRKRIVTVKGEGYLNCGMVFALPPLREPSGVKAMETLREELERHVRQTHTPDFPSDWSAENQSR